MVKANLICVAALGVAIACSGTCKAGLVVQNFDTPGTAYTIGNPGYTDGGIIGGGPTGDFMRLAEGKAISNSPFSIAFDRVATGQYARVTTEFDFRLTPVFQTADGLGFYLMNTSQHGVSGAVPNLSGGGFEPNIPGVFAVVFDIFNNAQGQNNPLEPNDNHISVHNDGTTLEAFNPGFTLADATWHHATIDLLRVSGGANLTVTFDAGTASPFTPISDYFIAGQNLEESRIGFVAFSGAAYAHHDIDNVTATFTPVPEPSSFGILFVAMATCALLRCWPRRRTARTG